MEKNPLSVFEKEAPEVASAYNQFIQSLIKTQGLDAKTKQLLYIGMKIVTGDFIAVKFHVPMAKKAGASREEIKDTILLTLTITGLKGISHSMAEILNIYDTTEL
ncbi:MAG: carboxymuconolactone decarboxylase family protein [Bacteroidetes bacterium]|nr:carboxymuconolactone decarboxylase family protein [Bacteroidota bacterium]